VYVCCSVLQYVTLCCFVLQWDKCARYFLGALHNTLQHTDAVCFSVLQCVAVCCSVLQYVVVCCSETKCDVALRCSTHLNDSAGCWQALGKRVLQCVSMFCSVSQCVAMLP